MPYITCPDGKIYSRYDNSDYVKWCICNEKKEAQDKFNACMLDPKCKENYEYEKSIQPYLISASILIIFLLFLLMIHLFYKLTKINQ